MITHDQSWCLKQAHSILESFPDEEHLILETGYGPSGRAHLGTLVENIRTMMVARALRAITSKPITILCLADDLDGMRKIPKNIENGDSLKPYIDWPLCCVPDPEGQHDSFGESNIATLQTMLDAWGLDNVTMIRASDRYKSGEYNQVLLNILKNHQKVLDVMLPHLGEERRQTYSPFMPICPKTKKVLTTGVLEYRESTIIYRNPLDEIVETKVTDGACKLQWKVDLAMHWMWKSSKGRVVYEMYGKDLLSSIEMATQICHALECKPPVTMMYEMFLNPDGARMSKSRGNSALTPQSWNEIAPAGSLEYFAFQTPMRAKRLDIMQLPTYVDQFINACNDDHPDLQYLNPNHLLKSDVTYDVLIELAIISRGSADIVAGMLQRHKINNTPMNLIEQACNYANTIVVRDFTPVTEEWVRSGMQELYQFLETLAETNMTPENIQPGCYEIGKKHSADLKLWFQKLYNALFGTTNGPRLGTFFAYAGKEMSLNLINNALHRV